MMMPRAPPTVAPTSLQAKLENPTPICFHVKQAAKSQRVSHAIVLPSILWRNRQTVACLVLRTKPRNRRSNFDT
jgi:hypothetical protein